MNENLKQNAFRLPRNFAARLVLTVGAGLLACTLFAQQNPPSPAQGTRAPAAAPVVAPKPTPSRVAAETASRKLKVSAAGDFYMVSSIDTKTLQIVLKQPTEVTQLVQVNAQTKYFDENGQALKLQGLRAGDTVFVVLQQKSAAVPIVVSIRRGPMTVDILHQRYF